MFIRAHNYDLIVFIFYKKILEIENLTKLHKFCFDKFSIPVTLLLLYLALLHYYTFPFYRQFMLGAHRDFVKMSGAFM